jgi:hypothetical protein
MNLRLFKQEISSDFWLLSGKYLTYMSLLSWVENGADAHDVAVYSKVAEDNMNFTG